MSCVLSTMRLAVYASLALHELTHDFDRHKYNRAATTDEQGSKRGSAVKAGKMNTTMY